MKKGRNYLFLVVEIFLIVLSIGGITLAAQTLFNRSTSIMTVEGYNVEYKGEFEVEANDLEPISDNLINIDTKKHVLRTEFSLRGVDTNKRNDIIYDVMLGDMEIDCALLNKYTKWNLYKNGELLSTGSLSPQFDADVLTENLHLTNIQEDLPLPDDAFDDYVFILWISESCDNIETCEIVDQSNILGSSLSMKIFIALLTGEKVEYERQISNETSCVNKPVLYEGMIPVVFKDNKIVKTEASNLANNPWYDYGNKLWANAVTLIEGVTLQGDTTVINEEDILNEYVWIPRYKYKTWNIESYIGDSYDAYNNGIMILFDNSLVNKDTNKNNEYMTHPAFSNGLTGFWISKNEYGEKNKTYEEYQNLFVNSTSLELASTRMVNNLEWGAVLYLAHSEYGVGTKEIGKSTTGNDSGVFNIATGYPEFVTGENTIGSAINEVRLSSDEVWYNGYIYDGGKGYFVRGGDGRGAFTSADIEMFDITSREVIVDKK